ncbi:FUSC family protein [Homoserinimonas sp. A447]
MLGTIRRTLAPSIRPARLLLALKTAIAAGLAWPIAQLLPGTVDEYSYYAPLGALISMMPTLMGSLRASLQTVLGLAIGIGLAWAVIQSPLSGVASVPLAVGLGVLLGGLRGLGAGRDYVPIAALFVLIIGGAQADDYSLGYVVQMGVGMAIGIVVNLVIVPPLRMRESANEIIGLRQDIADNLDSMAGALMERWPPEHQDWLDGVTSLESSLRAAEPVIEDARESRRINPRVWWHRYDLQEDYDDLAALGTLGRHTRELSETMTAAIWADPVPAQLPEELREPLSIGLARMAELVRAWNERLGEAEAAQAAETAIDNLDRREQPPSAPYAVFGSTTFTLRRMLAVIRARIAPPSA